jgi:hypothetical protein
MGSLASPEQVEGRQVSDREIEVTHAGEVYVVTLDIEVQWVDDSFDHEFGTEECGHWEIDWDATTIVSCTGPEGDEIDPDDVPGLVRKIESKAAGLDFSDWD